MADTLYILIAFIFFLTCAGWLALCQRLMEE